MTEQLSINFSTAREAGEAAATACLAKAQRSDPEFSAKAKAFILDYLKDHGQTSGEDLTMACKAAGIAPLNDDRAFGGVFQGLSRQAAPRIRCIRSDLPRKFGHGTSGGRLWDLVR